MPTKNPPETSKEAFRSLDPEKLSDTYIGIIKALSVLGEATTEECAAYMKEPHAKVWKRFSELARNEIIYRPGHKRLLKSGRNGYTWMLCTAHTPKTYKQEKQTNSFRDKVTFTDTTKKIADLTKQT